MNYSLRRVCRIVRLSRALVASLVEAGVVTPARGPRGMLEGAARCTASALLRFNAGVAYQRRSACRDAEACHLAALAIDPSLADAHHNLSLAYVALGEEQRAIRHYNARRRLERR